MNQQTIIVYLSNLNFKKIYPLNSQKHYISNNFSTHVAEKVYIMIKKVILIIQYSSKKGSYYHCIMSETPIYTLIIT